MKRVLWAAVMACGLTSAGGAAEMAVTVDDLPTHGALPLGMQRLVIAEQMITALTRNGVPEVVGFVNGGQLRDTPEHAEIVKAWLRAGLKIGNHTYSHLDLNSVPAEEYIADIERNEAVLTALAGPVWPRVFRYPYLQEGDTLQKRGAVRRWLSGRGYAIAQVTVHADDWIWNDAYVRCVTQSDQDSVEWLKRSFLDLAMKRLEWSQATSQAVFGRDIKHILLLHIGAFDAAILDDLIGAYRRAGVRMVGLKAAMADPVYALDPNVVWKSELPFTLQVARARGVSVPPEPAIPREKVEALCL
jgi:peptidoglycan/xylan/chitin deacetylase (PgdA/CDA1 family)